MELIATILFVLNIMILIGGGYYLLNNQRSKFDQILKQLNKVIKSNQFEKLNSNINLLYSQLKNSTNETVKQWNSAIKNEKVDEKKLELLEAAAKRYPSEKEFVEEIRKILNPLANKGDNLLVRREALIRLRDHANRFIDNCIVEDFDYALDFKNNVISSMETVVKKIDELRETNLSKFLNELENKITQLEKGPDDESLLQEIEKIDERLDQNLLVNYPTLQAKYEKLSKSLIQILSINEKESKAELRKYNEKTLDNAKKARELIENHSAGNLTDKITGPKNPVNYNEKKNLTKLVKLIASHNNSKLHPSTSNYLRMVEAEIFNTLSSEGKILFTELMINEAYK